MEAEANTIEAPPEQAPETQVEETLTAKQMAAAEEVNSVRARQLVEQQQLAAEPKPEEPNILGLAAQGMDVLHDAIRKHSNLPSHPEYVPPPRTERQMTALQEELEAGRRTQQKAEAQQASRPVPAADPVKEGFTTPAYRPNDLVPDPTIAAPTGFAGGTKRFGRDA